MKNDREALRHLPLFSTCSHRWMKPSHTHTPTCVAACIYHPHTTNKHEFTTKEKIMWQFRRAREKFEDATWGLWKWRKKPLAKEAKQRHLEVEGARTWIPGADNEQSLANDLIHTNEGDFRVLVFINVAEKSMGSLPWYDSNWETVTRRIPPIWHKVTLWETTLKISGRWGQLGHC